MIKIKRLIHLIPIILSIALLFYTRFVNLHWGLPYPMHPDERNMAVTLQNLNCQHHNLKECLNPHFFAYGQLPLYLGYLLVLFLKFWDGDLTRPISFSEATISLRIISAIASVINYFILIKIIELIFKKISLLKKITSSLIIIFSPFFIQLSHFGTTESLLMIFNSLFKSKIIKRERKKC